MAMTCAQIGKTLRHVENLIAGLEAMGSSHPNDEYLRALQSLRHHRAWLRGLLAIRRAERSNKVVSLELWKSGFDLASIPDRQATTARYLHTPPEG